MSNPMQTELWRLAQVAFDEGRSPAYDAQVLDLVLDDPSLMKTLDEVLLLESKLDAIGSLPVQVAPKVAPFGRVRIATVAAALLIAGLPFLGSKSVSEVINSSRPSNESIAKSSTPLHDSVTNAPIGVASLDSEPIDPLGAPPIPSKAPALSSIISFELSVSETTPPPRVREDQSLPTESRRPIRILSSTRTKSNLGGRTR